MANTRPSAKYPDECVRNYHFDNLKAVLIFFVVFGHLIEPYRQTGSILTFLYNICYILHMPLFVFMSGYFSKNTEKARKNAFVNLLIPYIIFNLLFSLYVLPAGEISVFEPQYAYWYILSMFFWRMLLTDVSKVRFALIIAVLFSVLCALLEKPSNFLAISSTIRFFPFFLMGYFFNDKMKQQLAKFPRFFAFVVFSLICAMAWFSNLNGFSIYRILYGNSGFIGDIPIWQGPLLLLAAYATAALAGLCFIRFVPEKATFFTGLGNSTLAVYLMHTFLVIAIHRIDERHSFLPQLPPFLQIGVFAVLAAVLVLFLGNSYFNRYFTLALTFLKKIVYKTEG
jgi:Fucose 4-O-acetylase and related acetyltransferases